MVTVDIANTDEALQQCLSIRRTVFIIEQNVPEEIEMDGMEDQTVHFLASNETQPLGTARLLQGDGYVKIQRVAVLKEARGTGAGAAIIRAMEDYTAEHNLAPRLELGAQVSAIGFYEKLGYEAYGDLFDDAGIPHRNMRKTL